MGLRSVGFRQSCPFQGRKSDGQGHEWTTRMIGVNSQANQLSRANYDLNGNMTSGARAAVAYNDDDGMSSAG
jgi:hypothetical protein